MILSEFRILFVDTENILQLWLRFLKSHLQTSLVNNILQNVLVLLAPLNTRRLADGPHHIIKRRRTSTSKQLILPHRHLLAIYLITFSYFC